MTGLTNLHRLWLGGGNQISDISPLSNLTNLQWLNLESNQITDIGPLSGLTNLRDLYLRHNQISDISPLVNNPGIGEGDEVDLRGNPLDIPQLWEKGAKLLLDTPPFWREFHQPLAEEGYITEGLILDPLEDTANEENGEIKNLFNPGLLDIGNEVGDEAPDFSLPDELENIVTLSDYRGKNNIVLIFHTGST